MRGGLVDRSKMYRRGLRAFTMYVHSLFPRSRHRQRCALEVFKILGRPPNRFVQDVDGRKLSQGLNVSDDTVSIVLRKLDREGWISKASRRSFEDLLPGPGNVYVASRRAVKWADERAKLFWSVFEALRNDLFAEVDVDDIG